MGANQFCRDENTAPAHVARRLARARDGGGTTAFAGDIRMHRPPFGHSRVRERAINRVLAARCTDLALLAHIGETPGAPLQDLVYSAGCGTGARPRRQRADRFAIIR